MIDFRPLGQVLGLTAKLGVKLAGWGIGKIREVHARQMGNYSPKLLRSMGALELIPEGVEIYTITMPKESEWDVEQAQRFLAHLAGISDFALQISATSEAIQWHIVNWMDLGEGTIENIVTSYYPQATLNVDAYLNQLPNTPFHRVVHPLQLTVIYPAPIFQAEQVKRYDPLAVISEAMNQLGSGERVVLTLLTTHAHPDVTDKGLKMLTQSNLSAFEYLTFEGAYFAEMRKMHGVDQQNIYTSDLDKVMRQKLSQPLHHGIYLVQTEAANEERAVQLLNNVLPHTGHFANPPFNGLYPADPDQMQSNVVTDNNNFATDSLGLIRKWLAGTDDAWKQFLLILSPSEQSGLWHLPHQAFTSTNVNWIKSRQVRLPKALRGLKDGYPIGHNRYGMQYEGVKLPPENFAKHMAIFGKNGTGKSSLQNNLIVNAINEGLGVCLLDPKGTAISVILQHGIPDHRIDDVVILDLKTLVNGVFYPPQFNLLAFDKRINPEAAVRRFMRVMETIYPEFADKRMADTLTMTLLTLAAAEQPTLIDAIRVLEDVNYRDELVAQLDDFTVHNYWKAFDLKTDGQRQELIDPIVWRLRAFYNNKTLRSMTCHPDGINLSELISENKIILVSLADAENVMPQQERFVLGAALVAQFDMVVRTGVIKNAPYMLYIDEAQEFVNTDLPSMLSQVREYGLGIVLANQYFRQLVGDTFDAIEGNVSTLISFEVGDRDAKALQNYMKPSFTANDLVSLGVHKAAVSLRYQQERQPAFSLETLPPPGKGKKNHKRENFIRQRSVENYTPKTYDEVNEWLNERYGTATNTGTNDDGSFE